MPEFKVTEKPNPLLLSILPILPSTQEDELIFSYAPNAQPVHRGIFGAVYHGWQGSGGDDAPAKIWAIKESLAPGNTAVFQAEYDVLSQLAQTTLKSPAKQPLSPVALLAKRLGASDHDGLIMPFYGQTFMQEVQSLLNNSPPDGEHMAVAQAIQYTYLLEALHDALNKTCTDRKVGDLRWHHDSLVVIDWNLLEQNNPETRQQELRIWGALWFEIIVTRPCEPPLNAFIDADWLRPKLHPETKQDVVSIGLRRILERSQAHHYQTPTALRADLEIWQQWLDQASNAADEVIQLAQRIDEIVLNIGEARSNRAKAQEIARKEIDYLLQDRAFAAAAYLTVSQIRLIVWDLLSRFYPDKLKSQYDAAKAAVKDELKSAALPGLVGVREAVEAGRYRDAQNALGYLDPTVELLRQKAALERWQTTVEALVDAGDALRSQRAHLTAHVQALEGTPKLDSRDMLEAIRDDLDAWLRLTKEGTPEYHGLVHLSDEVSLRLWFLDESFRSDIAQLKLAVEKLDHLGEPLGAYLAEVRQDPHELLAQAQSDQIKSQLIQKTLLSLWQTVGDASRGSLLKLYNDTMQRLAGDERRAEELRENASVIFALSDFLVWAAQPNLDVRALLDEMMRLLAIESFDMSQSPDTQIYNRLAFWQGELAPKLDRKNYRLAERLSSLVDKRIEAACEEIVEAYEEAFTQEHLARIARSTVRDLKSTPVRAWWKTRNAAAIEGAIEKFQKKQQFVVTKLPELAAGTLSTVDFLSQAKQGGIALSTLPPDSRLEMITNRLTDWSQAIDNIEAELRGDAARLRSQVNETVTGLTGSAQEIERAIQSAQSAVYILELSQTLRQAWSAANAFDAKILRSLVARIQQMIGDDKDNPHFTPFRRTFDKLHEYNQALVETNHWQEVQKWRQTLDDDQKPLSHDDRQALFRLVRELEGPVTSDKATETEGLAMLISNLKLLQALDHHRYVEHAQMHDAPSQAAQAFEQVHKELRQAFARSEVKTMQITLGRMAKYVAKLSPVIRPLAQDSLYRWNGLLIAHNRLVQALDTVVEAAKQNQILPIALLDLLQFHAQTAPPEAIHLTMGAWQQTFNEIEKLKNHDAEKLDAIRKFVTQQQHIGRALYQKGMSEQL